MTEADLLAAIIAAPDDDGPRMVYADWLSERGDPRGELIQVACLLAALPPGDPRRAPLERRAEEIGELEDGMLHPSFPEGKALLSGVQRGLPESLLVRADLLEARGAELFAMAPIRELHLHSTCPIGDAARLAAMPELARLRVLDCANLKAGDAAFATLLRSPHLGGLRTLKLGGTDVGPGLVETLGRTPTLAELEHLELQNNSFGDEGAAALAASPYLRSLKTLYLIDCGLRDAGPRALAESPVLASIGHLNLGAWLQGPERNVIGPAGVAALARSPHTSRMFALGLDKNRAGDEGAAALAKATGLVALRTVQLWQNEIGDAGARALALASGLPALEGLYLKGNPITQAGADALGESPGLPRLRKLGLTFTPLATIHDFRKRFPRLTVEG